MAWPNWIRGGAADLGLVMLLLYRCFALTFIFLEIPRCIYRRYNVVVGGGNLAVITAVLCMYAQFFVNNLTCHPQFKLLLNMKL